jgi:hypothetical protein
MSFTFATPHGYSYSDFVPDEEYCLGYFLEGLSFENGVLAYRGDYISGRCVKTDTRCTWQPTIHSHFFRIPALGYPGHCADFGVVTGAGEVNYCGAGRARNWRDAGGKQF